MVTRGEMPLHDGSLIARSPLPLLCEESCRPHPELAISGVSLARANSWQVLELDSLAWSIQTRCKWALWGPWGSSMFLHCLLFQIGSRSRNLHWFILPDSQHPSRLFLKRQPKMFYFDLSPDAKGFPSLLEALGARAPAAASSGMLPPWSWFVACFMRWCPTDWNVIAAMLQNQNRGENEFYVRKMPFESIDGRSKQHVGFFPQLAESSFLWDWGTMLEEQCQL